MDAMINTIHIDEELKMLRCAIRHHRRCDMALEYVGNYVNQYLLIEAW